MPTHEPLYVRDNVKTRALAEKLLEASVGAHPHTVVLEALLNAYMAVATAHPCCTQDAANAAFRACMQLGEKAAERPVGASVH